MHVPEGLNSPEGHVCKLHKALYGLKHSGRGWYLAVAKKLESIGLQPIFSELSIFTNQNRTLIIGLYADDMIITGIDLETVNTFKTDISTFWKIKDLGEIGTCLGIHITRDRMKKILTIDQC